MACHVRRTGSASRTRLESLESRIAPATFTVTTTANSGAGSLRQAIIDANAAVGFDTIEFKASKFSTPQTIKLTSGELLITESLSIDGPAGKVTISGNNATRIFHIQSATKGVSVFMSNLNLTAGKATGDTFESRVGAAIWGENAANLSLTNCLIQGNTFSSSAVYLGATDNDFVGGNLSAIDCVIKNNSDDNPGFNSGEAIEVYGHGSQVVLRRTTIADNMARGLAIREPNVGAGINGSLLIEDCTINGNSAKSQGSIGGGVQISGSFGPGLCVIRNSTISGNYANNFAGGIGLLSDVTLIIQNSTIAHNTAERFSGGGITVFGDSNAAVVSLESSIVAHNFTIDNGPADLHALNGLGQFTYKSSSVLMSTSSMLTDLGGNRPFGEDPLLAPLADNGGPTKTHALGFASPVVNKGSNPANLAFDQRGTGNPRSFNGGVDMGAYEINIVQVDTTVDEFDGNYSKGDLSLREAISLTAFPAVYFDPAVFATSQTITLTMGVFAIPGGRTIIGPEGRVTIDAGNASRIFNLTPTGTNVKNSLSNLILTGGNAGPGNDGGAIFASGFGFGGVSVTLTNCTLTGNSATSGGAIALSTGTLTIEDSTFTNNTASSFGGAISATFTAMKTFIRRSTISGNTANNAGGAYIYGGTYQSGISLIEDSTISNNISSQLGGGLSLKGNANTVRNSTISGNTAGKGGGVALITGGTAVIQNSTIAFNSATEVISAGGGISASVATPQIFLESSIVSNNAAPSGPDIAAAGTVTYRHSSIFSSSGVASFTDLGGNRPFGEDPMLAPLANNGGPTLTHSLFVGSPVIDKGSNPVPLADDQRGFGFDRVSGPAADIGALEVFQPALIPAFPESVSLSDYTPQRSRVTHWYITFAGTPMLPPNPADAFQVERQSDGALVQFTVTTVGSDVQLNFTGGPLQNGSLEDGRYTVRIFASQIPNLDANDDGIVGDDFTLIGDPNNKVFRLFGDSDGDGTVTSVDLLAFRLAFLSNSFVFDNDGSGQVDASDFLAFRLNFLDSV